MRFFNNLSYKALSLQENRLLCHQIAAYAFMDAFIAAFMAAFMATFMDAFSVGSNVIMIYVWHCESNIK
jgi:hypothetical protein